MQVIDAAGAEPTLRIDLGNDVKLDLVLVKHGTFRQGSPESEQGRSGDETIRQVTLGSDFYLGKFPVTVRQFARFVSETHYRTEAEIGTSGGFGYDGSPKLAQRKEFTWRHPGFTQTDDHPATLVTYNDALAFARWVAKKSGRKVDLPTEAEWEFACRAGTTTAFYAGDDAINDMAWYQGNAGDGTRPVGQKKPNAWGLYDMCGNVNQWCRDWYGPYEGASVQNPLETRNDRTKPARRVLRGGSWLRNARWCRSAARWRNDPKSRNADNGFRLIASANLIVESEVGRGPVRVQEHLAAQPDGARPATREEGNAGEVPVRPQRDFAPQSRDGVPAPAREKPVTRAPTEVEFFPQNNPPPLGFMGLGCASLPCVLLVGVAAVVLVFLFNLSQRSRSSMTLPRPGRGGLGGPGLLGGRLPGVELAADGFWLDLTGVAPDSQIRYQCLINGTVNSGVVVAESGPRQFVYTGGTPSEVIILGIDSPSIGPGMLPPIGFGHPTRPAPPPTIFPAHRSAPSSSSTFGGHPAAY
jgi:formylglycine-generating enzyme required for sulfatase activity